jgi:hypothetical protein
MFLLDGTGQETLIAGLPGPVFIALDLTQVPDDLVGDYNQNGAVDAADYVVWRSGQGTTYTQTDYDVWRTHFGQSSGSDSASFPHSAVPEPRNGLPLLLAAARGMR